ncbi:MAG TPA: carbohydrate binding family 9 domain-containing protein, partial [Pyrinomonadaceae bacterium]|nr:carbohydrate binding family 9 domain-containing protein [Pyrinomonadaceae bacterium]
MQYFIRLSIPIFVLLTLGAVLVQAQPAPSATPSTAAKPATGRKPAIVLPPEKAQPVRMPKFERPPVIDGKLDDEIWKSAAVLKDFYQTQPGDNIAPTQPTEVFLGYDAKFLYVAFHCFDEPDKVRATIPKRDNIWNDDYVGILFDTFNDGRKAYEFDFNPFGVQADGIWTDGQGEDFNPDIVMESKGVLTGDGWTVEVAIPFKSLRYVAGKDKLWGAHFWRRIKRTNNELSMWMPMNRDNSSWLAQEGHLSGLEGISTERTLELIPSLTVSETATRKPSYFPLAAGQLDPGRLVNEP